MIGVAYAVDERASESVLLHNAVKGNEQHMVTQIIERGADVDYFSREEKVHMRTPLRAACSQANVKVIRILISHGARVYAHFENDRWTALHSAAHAGHDHVVRLLLVETEELHENSWHDGFSLIHILGECLNARLLNSGGDLLSWALRHMPSMAIDAKSTRLGYSDWTALHIACARGWTKSAVVLMRSHAKITACTGEFHVRSSKVNEFVQSDAGAQVASLEPNFHQVAPAWFDSGLLPIHLAAFGGHLRTLQMLMKNGQSIFATTERHRWTPLMFAVWSGNTELVCEICRKGGRKVINVKDRRADGSEWTPLAIAVVRWGPDMVKALITYGADPLMRLGMANFPGQAFLDHVNPVLLDALDNKWSGPDKRISLLHLAVVRGSTRIMHTVLEFMRAAHFISARGAPPALAKTGGTQWQDDDSIIQGITQTQALYSRDQLHRQDDRIISAPVYESQDCDPIVFCTAEGWSPAVLAILLHTVDPMRHVPAELVEALPDPDRGQNTRADVFLELLGTGRSLMEDRPEASPPVLPQRFHDVSETLVSRVIDEFVRLCKANGAERVAYRIAHATLCVACRFNRLKVVKNLLDAGLVDPCCRFLKPVECRPLHIATACGFGYLAQMLLEHKADPLEGDENAEFPVYKLARFYHSQITQLTARVSDLETQLQEAHASKLPLSDLNELPIIGSNSPKGPSMTTHIGSVLYSVAR